MEKKHQEPTTYLSNSTDHHLKSVGGNHCEQVSDVWMIVDKKVIVM